MQISIIIPVYNTEKYIKKAILSALEQKETAEVIIVDDGSTDNSFSICQQLAEIHNKVRVFQHPDLANHGPGASRNLGMRKINFDFFAFLDADDYYLANRFEVDKSIFYSYADVMGVYGAFDTIFEDKEKKVEYLDKLKGGIFVTFEENVPAKDLFYEVLSGKKGHFYLEGLTLRTEIINQVGFFEEGLIMGQDIDFIWRLCANFKLMSGSIDKAIGIRRIHGNNSIFDSNKSLRYRHIILKRWLTKILQNNWQGKVNRKLFKLHITYIPFVYKQKSKTIRLILKVIWSLWILILQPKLFWFFIKK